VVLIVLDWSVSSMLCAWTADCACAGQTEVILAVACFTPASPALSGHVGSHPTCKRSFPALPVQHRSSRNTMYAFKGAPAVLLRQHVPG
jgi:hypothetical protein